MGLSWQGGWEEEGGGDFRSLLSVAWPEADYWPMDCGIILHNRGR